MNGRRFASLTGAVAVTVIAAVASYDHMRTVALDAGQSPLLAALLPLSVDGLVLVGTVALGDGRRSKASAWAAFLVGVAASLAANVMAADPDAVSRAVSAWPAVALLLTVEVLARSGRTPATATATPATASAILADRPATATATPPATPVTPAAEEAATAPARADVYTPEHARPLVVATMDESPRAGSGRAAVAARPPVTDALTARVAALVADRPDVTAQEIAEEIGRAPRTARRYLAAARAAMATPATVATAA